MYRLDLSDSVISAVGGKLPLGDVMAARKTTDKKSGAALGDVQKTQPKEFGLPKIGAKANEEPKNAYEPSPPAPSFTVQTHDRDSVQPGPEPEGVYAPEMPRKGQK